MSLYYLILWNQVDILQKHFKKDHVHMRLWMRFYGMNNRYWILKLTLQFCNNMTHFDWSFICGLH